MGSYTEMLLLINILRQGSVLERLVTDIHEDDWHNAERLREITLFEKKVNCLTDRRIEIDLGDGVKRNYEIFADVLAKI